ncbi:MAG TPA: hypothetical protein DDX39_09370 [Bacteroidales bacterium]|nr:hypothetical protein [Bacteroidales bacterium]
MKIINRTQVINNNRLLEFQIKIMKKSFVLIFLFVSFITFSQESPFQKFKKISCAEKRWVLFHPFIAKKTFRISSNTSKISNEMLSDSLLDGDGNGGQVDAFRHAFWMASLSQQIRWRAVYKLGKAHEKGNKKDFKKHRFEEGTLPDEPSCQMDYLNNDIGIAIGRQQDNISQDSLIRFIKQEILLGKMFVLKKNKLGNFLDADGNVLLLESYQGKWLNEKCIVSSNLKSKTIE